MSSSNKKTKILVVDDDIKILELVVFNLQKRGYDTLKARNLTECIETIEENPVIDIILLDVMLPEGLSHNFLDQIISADKLPVVIMITASNSVEYAVTAMKKGAFDYLQKPFDFEQLFESLERAERQSEAQREIIRLRSELTEKYQFGNIIGNHAKMKKVFKTVQQLTNSNVSVLIRGETGTGKELLARAIHYNSQRKNKPFVVINSAAIPDTLIESELFGYEKGAFTGADRSQSGKFEQADGGTLFLDEIGDMPLKVQVKILRAIQEKEISRVGSDKSARVDVRIITATHQDLEKLINEKQFREDLYYRISVFPIELPSLNERKSDIALLVKHFLEKYKEEVGKASIKISSKALNVLMNYDWPGNIRELENCIQRAMVLIESDTLEKHHLPLEILSKSAASIIPVQNMVAVINPETKKIRTFTEIEKDVLQLTLDNLNGNIAQAAEELELGRATLYRKVKDLKLTSPKD